MLVHDVEVVDQPEVLMVSSLVRLEREECLKETLRDSLRFPLDQRFYLGGRLGAWSSEIGNMVSALGLRTMA
jgi:hypothetical protein